MSNLEFGSMTFNSSDDEVLEKLLPAALEEEKHSTQRSGGSVAGLAWRNHDTP